MTQPSSTLGVLELTDRGSGFIRRRSESYLPHPADLRVSPDLIRRYGLRTGDEISGEQAEARPNGDGQDGPTVQGGGGRRGRRGRGRGRDRQGGGGGAPGLATITAINGLDPATLAQRPDFAKLPAIHPRDPLVLECGLKRFGQRDYTNRIIDLLCPFGKGQRALIVAPAKAGKTMVLQAIAEGVAGTTRIRSSSSSWWTSAPRK